MLNYVETRRQMLRYAVIGLVSNAALYVAYLVLNSYGMGHKAAMTAVYCVGVLGTFVFNRRWTFDHGGTITRARIRYAGTYALVYLFNMASLQALIDTGGLPHQWVVLVLTFASAGIIFLLQKFWVFADRREAGPG